ncbi:hypothetical protein LTS08_003826 [Lithohypha guttulata]|nr:hypothetical protein LTS08_003826 [Lithohypha guttulata]
MAANSVTDSNAATTQGHNFPPVRACIFDMDGLLIDSEDAYTRVTNIILNENGRPDLPWSIKAQLQGRPGPSAGKIFRAWAQLPITEEAFLERQRELQRDMFKHCKPLPGVVDMLNSLAAAHTDADPTSSHGRNYDIKTAHMKEMFTVFPEKQKIVGDDERIPKGRGKPLPDIYLLALQTINEQIRSEGANERDILPGECLVFEDSVPGAESGRRAGMRVVWVPHPGLLDVYKDRVEEVLAGRTGEHDENDSTHHGSEPLPGSPGKVGELNDGWGERLNSLEDFDYRKYGIVVRAGETSGRSGQDSKPDQGGHEDNLTPVPVFENPPASKLS